MKQRIKLAQALVHDPDLLFLDEPTNGMDPKGRDEMLELVRDLAHNKGVNLILSSHLLPDVEYTCDHVIVLDKEYRLPVRQRPETAARPSFTIAGEIGRGAPGVHRRLRVAGLDAMRPMKVCASLCRAPAARAKFCAAAADLEQVPSAADVPTLEDVCESGWGR